MKITESLKERRSYYAINRELPVPIEQVIRMTEELAELVPDAFNMKSSRVVVVYGEKQDQLWSAVYDAFDGQVPIVYFYDRKVVESLQKQFPLYADNFPVWASQSSGMLQLSVWSGLRELEIGASLQHYNPVIDKAVKDLLHLPEEYVLIAQMPFGGIEKEPAPKEREDIKKRVFSIC